MMLQYRFSNDLFDLIRHSKPIPVLGNHDAHILAPGGAPLRRSGSVRPDHLEYQDSLPTVLELEVGGKLLMMMHTSPLDPTGGGRGLVNGVGIPARHARVHLDAGDHELQPIDIEVLDEPRAARDDAGAPRVRAVVDEYSSVPHSHERALDLPEARADVLIVGHTHLPIVTQVNGTLVINPGSLAQPRDVNNPDLRTYAVLDTETWEVEQHSFKEEIGAVYR